MDSFLVGKCYLLKVASVGDYLRCSPGLPAGWYHGVRVGERERREKGEVTME